MELRKETNAIKRGHEEGCRVPELGQEEGSTSPRYSGRAVRRVPKNTGIVLEIRILLETLRIIT